MPINASFWKNMISYLCTNGCSRRFLLVNEEKKCWSDAFYFLLQGIFFKKSEWIKINVYIYFND